MKTNTLKTLLFLLILLRQITVLALISFIPQLTASAVTDLAILMPVPIFLLSRAIRDALRQKYRLHTNRPLTRYVTAVCLLFTGLYVAFPIILLVYELHCPLQPKALRICLIIIESLLGILAKIIFEDQFKGKTNTPKSG